MQRVKGALLVAAVVFGLLLLSGTVGTLSSTPTGVFAIVSIMAIMLLLAGWFSHRR